MEAKDRILILGIGNYLMGDEGVGVHFIQELEREKLPEGVDIMDGGTAGFQLIGYLEQYSIVIIVDATLDKNPPGTIRLIEPRFAKDFPTSMSTHEIGLKDLVDSLTVMGKLPEIHLYVVSVKDIANLHVGLSEEVGKAIHELKEMIREKIATIHSPSLNSL